MSYKRILAFTAILGLSACASYESIRDRDPDRTSIHRADRVVLGTCVLDEARLRWDGSTDMQWVDLPISSTSRIVARYRTLIGSSLPMVNWDVTFKSEANGKTKAEVRAPRGIWGQPLFPDDLPKIIESCAAKLA